MLKPKEKKDGIWTSQQCRLLNQLGFTDVTIVTAEQAMVDFSWAKCHEQTLCEYQKALA